MNTFINPDRELWKKLCERPQLELEFLEGSVKNIIARVRTGGDSAILELTRQFDGVALDELSVSAAEIAVAEKQIDEKLKKAIAQASANIRKFHESQRRVEQKVETMPGVSCWRRTVPINPVGIYIPGGSAPLFSTVLMLAIPANLAGCNDIVLCTPPDKEGSVHPAILYAAVQSGVKKIFKVGGAQAIAAMATGTASIPRVNKIFGPGNQYVTKAKQMVNQFGIAIDMPAGPSEVLVMADTSATPSFVAADLLSQAEHGADSQVVLVVNDLNLVRPIQEEIAAQLDRLPRKGIAEQALRNARFVVFEDPKKGIEFVNAYAPEHLIINTSYALDQLDSIHNAGSVFLGNYAAEAIGDYASGTNHTLPTGGYAKSYSGVSLDSFCKTMTVQEISPEGLKNIAPTVECMAEAESLDGHKMAVELRRKNLES